VREPFVGSTRLRLAGLALHAYTASGTVLALLIVIAAIDGNAVRALWLGLAALWIDGTDGMIDNIVDYLTYAFAPIVLLWTGNYLPHGWYGAALAALPLLASSYQFCRVDAKTDDHFFLGFPSYWNVVAFYVVILGLGHTATALILLICSILVFVPVKYVYPSRTKAFRSMNLLTTLIWLAAYAVLLTQMPDPNPIVVAISLAYLVYYAGLSLYLTFWVPRRTKVT